MSPLRPWMWMALALAAGAGAALLSTPPGPPAGTEGRVRPPPEAPRREDRSVAPPCALFAEAVSLGDVEAARAVLDEVSPACGADAPPHLVELLGLVRGTALEDELVPEVLHALEVIGGAAGARALIDLGRELPPRHAEQAATRLSRIAAREAAPILVRTAREERLEGPLAEAAVRALGATRLREHVPFLSEACRPTVDPAVRRAAVESLGAIADPAALGCLEALLDDPDRRIRRAAIAAIGRVRTARAIEVLENRVARPLSEQERRWIRTALDGLRGVQRSPFR